MFVDNGYADVKTIFNTYTTWTSIIDTHIVTVKATRYRFANLSSE